jgi:hypothetical protein
VLYRVLSEDHCVQKLNDIINGEDTFLIAPIITVITFVFAFYTLRNSEFLMQRFLNCGVPQARGAVCFLGSASCLN